MLAKDKKTLKIKNLKSGFFKSLFIINRTDRAKVFILQIIFGALNLILFLLLVTTLIIFRNDLLNYKAIIIYLLYLLYNIINMVFSFYFYLILRKLLNVGEKKYFLSKTIYGFFGINLFTSINFYLKSGFSKSQKQKVIWMVKKNRIQDILSENNTQSMLSKQEKQKIDILFQLADDGYENRDNINSFILKFLVDKGIKTKIMIKNSEIIKYKPYL